MARVVTALGSPARAKRKQKGVQMCLAGASGAAVKLALSALAYES